MLGSWVRGTVLLIALTGGVLVGLGSGQLRLSISGTHAIHSLADGNPPVPPVPQVPSLPSPGT